MLSAALCLSLTACGGESSTPAEIFDPAADVQTLLDSGAFSETLTEIDQETACLLYGIDEATVTGSAVYGSTGATAEEVAIFTFGSEEDTAAAGTALQYRVEDRIEGLADYLPNEIPKLEKAVLEVRGSSVLLVIAADYAPVDAFLKG